MYISDLIEDFLEHLEIESGRSQKTIENYRLYLERFLEITTEILNKDDVKASDIDKEVLRKYRLKLNRYGSDNGGDDLKTITETSAMYFPYDNPRYSIVIVSPNSSHYLGKTNYIAPINSKISKKLTKNMFENY